MLAYLLFWYQVLTCVSVRLRASATSALSATLKYFWHLNFLSRYCNWACVNAVRLRRGFFILVNVATFWTAPGELLCLLTGSLWSWPGSLSCSFSFICWLLTSPSRGELETMSRSASLSLSDVIASPSSNPSGFLSTGFLWNWCSFGFWIALKKRPSTKKFVCRAETGKILLISKGIIITRVWGYIHVLIPVCLLWRPTWMHISASK